MNQSKDKIIPLLYLSSSQIDMVIMGKLQFKCDFCPKKGKWSYAMNDPLHCTGACDKHKKSTHKKYKDLKYIEKKLLKNKLIVAGCDICSLNVQYISGKSGYCRVHAVEGSYRLFDPYEK